MSTEQQKKIFPDQLNIIINTSIPGYQKIEYNPSMTVKDTEERAVFFNPLIKLNQSIINKIPEEYRIKEFFNKGLFQSMLNYMGSVPVKNLIQATRYGYVDNNIKITLNTIFPVGSVIYIGKKPYAIGDVQWTTGDWKIDIKQKKEEIDPSKISDPKLYAELVREEIISGEEQLQQLPESIIKGINYTGPPINVARGVTSPAPPKPSTSASPLPPKPSTVGPIPSPAGPPPAGPPPAGPPSAGPPSAGPPSAGPSAGPLAKGPIIIPPPPAGPLAKGPIIIPPPPAPKVLKQIINDLNPPLVSSRVEEISPEEERLYESFKSTLKIGKNQTKFFRDYFNNKKYFELIRLVFSKFPDVLKSQIKAFYHIVTNYEPRQVKTISNLSPTSYTKLCDQVDILETLPDGDCFFTSLANGINIYNYENQSSKIIYANYGKTQLFTVAKLRDITLEYFISLGEDRINEYLQAAQVYADLLNESFENTINDTKATLIREGINTGITPQLYMDTLNNIYKGEINFLVYKPNIPPVIIDEYNRPFRILRNDEIPAYMKSKEYWANTVAIDAICKKLKISVVSIERYTYTNMNINLVNAELLNTATSYHDLINSNCSKKTIFLYLANNHYDLIRFKYYTNIEIVKSKSGIREEKKYKSKYYTIFSDKMLLPPIHILFLIFGSSYLGLARQEARNNFPIYNNIMSIIYQSFTLNLLAINFKNNFIRFFPNSINNITNLEANLNIDENRLIGGLNNSSYNYKPYGYRPSNIIKKPEERGSSKIAYTITIDMELHPGTSLTPQQISESKCNNKYNSIRKAFAEFTGRPYIIPPVYNKTVKNKPNVNSSNIKQNIGNKTRKNIQ